MATRFKDYYRILHVHPSADSEVIVVAYKRLVRKYHPDVNHTMNATRHIQELNEAYEILSDPIKRAQYNQARGINHTDTEPFDYQDETDAAGEFDFDGLHVSNIASKIMSDVDSSGDVWFSVKATVTNTSKSKKKVDITVQAIDEEGFELKSQSLYSTLKAGETKILTDKIYMKQPLYNSIKKWQLKH